MYLKNKHCGVHADLICNKTQVLNISKGNDTKQEIGIFHQENCYAACFFFDQHKQMTLMKCLNQGICLLADFTIKIYLYVYLQKLLNCFCSCFG